MSKYILTILLLWTNWVVAQVAGKHLSMFHATQSHQGVYTQASYNSLGPVKWKYKTNGKIFSSPAVYNGVAYIGSEDHGLYSIDAKDGKFIWKFVTGGAVYSSPAVYKNVVYFGSYDGFFYAVNAVTGKLIWKFKTTIEKKAGAKGLWTMKPLDKYMEDPFDFFLSSPVLDMDDKEPTVYFGSGDGNMYALNASNGKKRWSFK